MNQKLATEKYWLSAENDRIESAKSRRSSNSLFQFALASLVILLVVGWQSWLPFIAGQIDLAAEFMIAIYHG